MLKIERFARRLSDNARQNRTSIDGNRPEQDRVIRRADWRFLLPVPNPEKSICLTTGLLEMAVQYISKETVDAQSGNGMCDLAVAVDPNERTLSAAWSALRPGGVIYTEWTWPSIGPRGVEKRLKAAGFLQVECYHPWPARATPRCWIPLDCARAGKYWLVPRVWPSTWSRRVRYVARWLAWRGNSLTDSLRPMCSVSRKPANEYSLIHTRGLAAHQCLARWKDFSLGPPPDELSQLLLTGGTRSINKVVALLFAGDATEPTLVAKMSRVAAAQNLLRREADNLQMLRTRPGEYLRGIPRVLFVEQVGGVTIVGQTAVNGAPIAYVVRSENHRNLALSITRWLIDLAGQPRIVPRDIWLDRLAIPMIEDVRQCLGSVIDPWMLDQIKDLLSALGPLPLVPEHRDFGLHNLVIDGQGQIGVLDWESMEPAGLPVLDLIFVLADLGFTVDSVRNLQFARASYRRGLDPTTPTGSVLQECLRIYMAHLNLDAASLPALRLLTWLVHCRWLCRDLTRERGRELDLEVLRRSRMVAMLHEELRIQTATG